MNIGPLIERPDSPQITGIGEDKKITRIFNVAKSVDIDPYIPQKGAVSPDGDGYFQSASVKTKPGYNIVAMVYSASVSVPSTQEASRKNNSIEYDFNINVIEKPIEKHPSYKVCWNNDLWGWSATTTAPAAPTWFLTATDKSDATGTEKSGGYLWSQSKPGAPKSGYWIKVGDRQKPGVEIYPLPQPVVTAQKYCKKLSVAEAFLPSTIAKAAPARTYGWPSDNDKWLKFPVGISNDGTWFVATVEYQYADDWDSDIYS